MKRRNVLIGLISAPAIIIAGTRQAAARTFNWKLASPLPPGHVNNAVVIEYLKRVKERSKGQINIEVIPLDSVGLKELDLLRVLKQGTMDAAFFAQFYAFRDDPVLANYLPSGGLTDAEQNLKIIDIQYDYAIKALKKRWNVVVVAPIVNRSGRDLVLVSKTPIHSLDQLKGKKVREFEKTGMQALQSLGVAAQIVAQADLYIALRTGVVDAAIHGITNVRDQTLWEVTPFFSEIFPFTGQSVLNAVVLPQANWDKLSPAQQKLMKDVAQEIWNEGLAEWRAMTKTQGELYQLFITKGMTQEPAFNSQDRKTIQAAMLAAWKQECERLGPEAVELYARVNKALAT